MSNSERFDRRTSEATMIPAPNPRVEPLLVLSRVFEGPQRRGFEAWTRPERVVRGWALPGFTVTALQNELWPGGAHRTALCASDGGETRIEGVYREVCPPGRLAFTQRWIENG